MKKYIVFLLLFSFFELYSQKAEIKGKVIDKKTKETIVGANVFLKGTTIGSYTDLNGNYVIKNIEPGTYDIVCSFVSYQTIIKEGVKLEKNKTLTIDFEIEDEITALQGVTVTARKAQNTDVSVISSIKSSQVVVSGISNQQIKQSLDSDASQVVRRIPGVTVIGNRFIMIRGLSERYNAVLLHDVFAPSMEADVRSFSFDVVPSNLIDRILIFKSPSPELPGDFAGGVVKIYTKGIPDENNTQISYSTKFRENSSFKPFYHSERGKLYWTGFNDGYSNLPEDFPKDIRTIDGQPELIEKYGKSFRNNWIPKKSNSFLDQSISATLSRKTKIKSKEIGNITSISYSNSKNIYYIKRKDFNAYDFENQRSSLIFDFNDDKYAQDIRLGVLHNWAISLNANNSIEFKNIFNQLSSSEYIHRTGPMYEFNYYANNHSFYQIYRGIYSGQLTGSHKFKNESSIDWVVGYGLSYRQEPDYRRYRSDLDTNTGHSTLYVPFGAAQAYFLGRFYSDMNENNYTSAVNYKKQFSLFKNTFKPTLQTGIFYEYKDRYFIARNIGYVRSSMTNFNNALLDVSIDSLFHPDNINMTTGIRIDEQSNPSDSYEASNDLKAGYVSVLLPLTHRLKLSGGLRTEFNTQTLNSHTFTNDPVNVDVQKLFYLPSANLAYDLTEKMIIRFTYGKTLNKPEFRELAPFGFYDFNFNLVRKGSDTIKISTAHSFDLRWEMYPSANEFISFGVFYKRFNQPIENTFVPGGGSGGIKTFTFANADAATSRGAEIEIRKSLEKLTSLSFFDNLKVLLNMAIIDSKVELGSAALGQGIDSRPMYGQSPYIVNAGLFYYSQKTNLNVTVLYNVIGKRIYIIGFDDYPNIYEMPRHLLELTATKKFKNNIELKFGIGNILNQDSYLIQDANKDKIFDRKKDQIIQYYRLGRTVSLGLSYSF